MSGRLSSARGAIVVAPDEQPKTEVPVADVAVVLVGVRVSFSVAAMHRLLDQDIAVVFCDWKGVPEGAAYGWSSHGRIAARHRAQAYLSVPRQKNAWGQIIRAKVKGQANVLRDRGRIGAKELASLAREVRSGDPGNIEARAARLYWKALWGDEGFSRLPGKSSNPTNRNAHLDYAYTVLRGHGIRAVLGAGLAPSLGIFHRQRNNNFALVDDLIEPFRACIDDAVVDLESTADITDAAVRKHLVNASSRQFLPDGKTVSAAFDELAQQFGLYVEHEVKALKVAAWLGRAGHGG